MIFQTLCLVAAGYSLWRLWAVIARRGVLVAAIVGIGLAGRSLAGQALFWVSYLKLPYGRSLQLGDGLWFFGLDALHYYGAAKTAALQGLGAVFTVSHYVPSVVYVKVMALFLWLFGIATSTAILMNLFTYLGTAALIVVCAERRRVHPRITALTLAAISFLPSSILWALQPLKDAFVLFLAVLFAFMVDELVTAWRGDGGRARTGRVIFAAAMLAVTTYALAGIRWYYAVIMLVAASIPLLAIIVGARGGRATAMRAAVMLVLMIVLTQNVVAGAGPYLPAGMRAVLRPWTAEGGGLVQRIGAVTEAVTQSRENFDRYKGAGTRIRAGATVAEDESAKTKAPPKQVAAAPTATPPPAPINPPMQSATAEPAATTTRAPATTTHAPAVTKSPRVAKTKPAPRSDPKPVPPAPKPAPVQSVTPTVTPAVKPAVQPTVKPAVKPAAPAPVAVKKPAPVRKPENGTTQFDVPTTARGRLVTGLAALLLPRKVAAGLGLVSIGGGRGLMWFVDLDTVLFNIFLISCVVVLFTGLRRGAWRDAFLWYLVVATVIIASALAYTVSNFGTLFRHRQMVVATLALIGIAAARPRPDAVPPRNAA